MLSTIDWAKIHLLEGRLAFHRSKAGYDRKKLAEWKITGDRAHYWLDQNLKKGNRAAAKSNEAEIARVRPYIAKWKKILDPEELEIHKLEAEIRVLKPKAFLYQMGGWVRPGEPCRMQRQDKGQDFEIPTFHSVVAPGNGVCLTYAHDGPFPGGFGSPYAVVEIFDGPFGGNQWYLGHANEPIIRPGQHFSVHQPLARLNNSKFAGWGWIEVGHWSGGPGSNSEGERYHHLFVPRWMT